MISESIIADADVTITLPFPISVNSAFRRYNGKHLSARYRTWRDEAGWELKRQHPRKITGPVTAIILLRAPDRRKRDGDNLAKGIFDLLAKHRVIEDDNRFVVPEHSVKWIEDGPPRAVVSIRRVSR